MNSLLTLFYPHHCSYCRVSQKMSLSGEALCSDCQADLLPIKREESCSCCSFPFLNNNSSSYCLDCAHSSPAFDSNYSIFHYKGIVKELIKNYKYYQSRELASLMKSWILSFLERERDFFIHWQAVVPIPLSSRKKRERGYNPTEPLATFISNQLGVSYKKLLIKTRETPSQASLSREERLKNIQGSFSLKCSTLSPGNYLVIDDVFTTGSTINEAASLLKKAGATKVISLTLAR